MDAKIIAIIALKTPYLDVWFDYPLERQEKNASETVVCWSRLLQVIA